MTDLDRQRSPTTGPGSGGVPETTPGTTAGTAPGPTSGAAAGVTPGTASGLTFEAARAELEDVVRRLEAGGCALEESLALWERGEELAALCQRFLDGARARLTPATTSEPS
ncbi:exodeoxyribonuclease VII, small subunit [Parafrankia sp. EAN1pec]|uniref:exodeoxyribonuclease VII small subunit n=1 Tax=Parafrankia sp. (strain EAN1pec) TaxID=298653 RepID=UPI0000540BD8|nr:exodeoxyribonuclease VII, small subunit [Frankia sp. EAN1pec]